MDYVIIGGSAAGISCAESIRKLDKKSKITVISDEEFTLYSRCLLTYYIADKIKKQNLKFKEEDFFKRNSVEAVLGRKAERLDLKKKLVILEDKSSIPFDKLLIATGGSPKKLNIPGEGLKGVFGLRTIKDAEGIISMLDGVKHAVILGGGLIGLRDAYALNIRHKKVSVVVKSPHLLSQMLDSEGAGFIEDVLVENGIEIMKGSSALEIIGKKGVQGVVLDNKQKMEAEMVIVGKGVQPNINIAETAGIKVKEGILVDSNLKTSHADVYAAGDAAETYDLSLEETTINAIWPAAVEEGSIAGLNMAGQKKQYDGSMAMNSIDFYGLAAISLGITKPQRGDFEEIKFADTKRRIYKKVVLKDNLIKGMVLIGRVANAGVIGILARKRIDVRSIKDELLKDNFDYAKIMPLVRQNSEQFADTEFQDTIAGMA